MRIGYFGPAGTFTHEALLTAVAPGEHELVPLPTIHDTVHAVRAGDVEEALVPIENSVEGSVNATLDALATEWTDVAIVGETVLAISHCLIAAAEIGLGEIEVVVSHPQPTAQCAAFLRNELPKARVVESSSTAEAVRTVAEHGGVWAALGNRLAAELYDCKIIRTGVEDHADNTTRFVWLAPVGPRPPATGAHKTAIVFWGAGDEAPGWLVRCLSEISERGVNLTRIESRPRKLGLGHYMFFADLEGGGGEPNVAAALAALATHSAELRILGSYPVVRRDLRGS